MSLSEEEKQEIEAEEYRRLVRERLAEGMANARGSSVGDSRIAGNRSAEESRDACEQDAAIHAGARVESVQSEARGDGDSLADDALLGSADASADGKGGQGDAEWPVDHPNHPTFLDSINERGRRRVGVLRREGVCSGIIGLWFLSVLGGMVAAAIGSSELTALASLVNAFIATPMVIAVCISVLTGPVWTKKFDSDGNRIMWGKANRIAAVLILLLQALIWFVVIMFR